MTQNKDGVIEIDLLEVFSAFIKKAWLVILCIVLFAAGGFCYAFYGIDPTYQSGVMFYVNNTGIKSGIDLAKMNISSADITAAKSLVDTYIVILETRNTLDEVIRESGDNLQFEELSDMISASAVNDTEVFRVTVTSTDPMQAEHLANTIADVLPRKIASIVEGSSARVVDYAIVPTKKSAPSLTKYTMIGALIGFIIAAAIIIILMLMDSQIHDEDYLINTYQDIPLLGVIPDLDLKRSFGKYYKYSKNKYSADYYNTGKSETENTKTEEGKTEEGKAEEGKAEEAEADINDAKDGNTKKKGQPKEVVRTGKEREPADVKE